MPSQRLVAEGLVPPQNLEAEQTVLGTVLLEESALPRIAELLAPQDFYRPAHQAIFRAMLDLFNRNEPQDLITVSNLLQERHQLDELGGAPYLAELTSIIPGAGNLVHHAVIIRNKAVLRRLIQASSTIAGRCYDEQERIETLVDEAEQQIFDIARSKSSQSFHSLREIIPQAFARVEALARRKEHITGVPTGYRQLDHMTAGLQPSDLIILAARPSMGKTALALNMVQNAALQDKVAVAIFSLEMSKEQLALRLLCSVGRIDSQRVRTGMLHEGDWSNLTRATGMLSVAPIFIDDTPAISVLEMRAKARRLKAEHNIGLVVVDYLQLMRGVGQQENRVQEISEISRSLKAMAKELQVPVLALSQLNRSLESRTDKRPQLSDLRESGAIEQDADLILFIYRDEIYNKALDNPQRGLAEIGIGKQRNGPVGTIKLAFLPEYTRFEDYAPREDAPMPLSDDHGR